MEISTLKIFCKISQNPDKKFINDISEKSKNFAKTITKVCYVLQDLKEFQKKVRKFTDFFEI